MDGAEQPFGSGYKHLGSCNSRISTSIQCRACASNGILVEDSSVDSKACIAMETIGSTWFEMLGSILKPRVGIR